MANQYTATPIPEKQELTKHYKSGLTQAEVGREYGVSQKVVYSWFKKLNIKSRVPKKKNQNGEDNDSWKGNNAGYGAFHVRVRKSRGKANKCEVCSSGKYFEWANLTGEYSNIFDYKMMCKSCHAKYDKKYKNPKIH